jgi:hypothetical protein
MIYPERLFALSEAVRSCVETDSSELEALRAEIRPLRSQVRRIFPRSATAISLVGTDGGGNNLLRFDPFMLQLVRVVDSNQEEHCLEAVSRTTQLEVIDRRHLSPDGEPLTPLGAMMVYLKKDSIEDLSSTFKRDPKERKPSWVQVYREMAEWAVLFKLVREHHYGSDTIILFDGDLRAKMWKGDLFAQLIRGVKEAVQRQFEHSHRRIYVAGVLKHSKVLQTYRLAMALEGVMRVAYPCFVEVPRALELKVFKWGEIARGDQEAAAAGGEANKFVGGRLFFCKFGGSPNDPIWPVDLLDTQADQATTILGYLLADAVDGFPVPYYPQCLQRAHEHAALADFDFEVLQDEITRVLRHKLGEKRWVIDELSLQESDPSAARYS